MRILMLCYEYPPLGGGAGKVVQGLSNELVRQGHEVDVVTMGFRGLARREEQNGVRIYRLPSIRSRAHMCTVPEAFFFLLMAAPLLISLVKRRKYDLNHTHFIMPDGLLAWFIRRVTGLPYVLTAHGSDVPGYNPDRLQLTHRLVAPIWKMIVRNAQAIISPSESLEALILRTDPRAPTVVVPNGIRITKFTEIERKRSGILIVTRMFERKGVQFAIEALQGLDVAEPVRIVGDGPYLPVIKELVERLNVNVEFVGWLDHGSSRLWELYDTSRIFIFTSESENFPVVLLEAMAARLSIITTSDTGCAEVVGDTGILVPSRNAGAIRDALNRLLGDKELVLRLGDMARKRLEERFGWPAVAHQHETIYRQHAQTDR